MTTAEARPPLIDRLEDILLVLLIALRPLCWDGTPGEVGALLWNGLAAGALLFRALVAVGLPGTTWRWSVRGLIGALLVVALAPTVLIAPAPAQAWVQWGNWVAALAGAIFLAQAIPGRERLGLAALVAGGTGALLIALVQPFWVLPAMAAAQAAGQFGGLDLPAGDLGERIARGGVFGTFTLANQLAAFAAIFACLGLGLAAGARGWWRSLGAVLVAACLAVLWLAGAKGGWLVLAAGLGVAWMAWQRGWWRWLPLPLGLIAVLALWQSGVADASARVRWGYWRGAAALVAEEPWTGHGLGGFATGFPRVMQPGDEVTRLAHNEVLEAAVAGGIGLGILALAWLAALGWPRRDHSPIGCEPYGRSRRGIGLAIVLGVAYLAMLGGLDGNLGWWPGVAAGPPVLSLLLTVAWAVVLGLAMVAALLLALRLPALPAWAVGAALVATALHCLMDFDAHAGGLVGIWVALACLAPGGWREHRFGRTVPAVVALALAILVGAGLATGHRLARAVRILEYASAMRGGDAAAAAMLAAEADAGDPGAALKLAWDCAEGDPELRLRVLYHLPPTPEVLELAIGEAIRSPHVAGLQAQLAVRLAAAGRWDEALGAADEALFASGSSPNAWLRYAEFLDSAAAALPARASSLRQRAAEARAEAARLNPLVDPRQRVELPR